jgi:hypothetical protein
MIPEAREVRLRPKIRKVLEARCRAPSTPQGDVKRAQIVCWRPKAGAESVTNSVVSVYRINKFGDLPKAARWRN